MRVFRLAKWSLPLVFAGVTAAGAQEPATQKLFESGNYAAVAERAATGAPEDIYLAALAHLKTGNAEAAGDEMRRLQQQGNGGWKQIGASGVAMVVHDDGAAIEAGRRATEVAGDNPYAHYQLGLSAAGAGDFGTAAQAFAQSTAVKPDLAYAHFYAGQAYHKLHNLGKAAEHYQYFLHLAPDSPDRAAIQAVMRTLRK